MFPGQHRYLILSLVIWLFCASSVYGEFTDDSLTAALWHMNSKYVSGNYYYTPDDDFNNPARNNNLQMNYLFGNCDITTGGNGKWGEALSLDGDDWCRTPANAWKAYDSFIIDLWIKPTSFDQVHMNLLRASGPWMLYFVDYTGTLRFRIYDDALNTLGFVDSVVPLNVWSHIVAGYNGRQITLAVNDTIVSGTATSDIWLRQCQIWVGGEPSHPARGFIGLIDEVRISRIETPPQCGEWGYNIADINKDCYVNIEDLVEFSKQWLNGK